MFVVTVALPPPAAAVAAAACCLPTLGTPTRLTLQLCIPPTAKKRPRWFGAAYSVSTVHSRPGPPAGAEHSRAAAAAAMAVNLAHEARDVEEQYILRVKDPTLADELR